MNPATRVGVATAALGVFLACGLAAQTAPGTFSTAVGASFETYEFLEPEVVGLQRLSLVTLPIAHRAQLLDRLWVDVAGGYAHGSLRRADGTDASLSGLTDTEVRASYAFGRDLLVVSAAVLAPTGRTSHDLDEAEVAGTIAADLLPTRISQWGAGGGLNLSTALALPAGEFNVGVAVGYTVAREFDALELPEETWAYRPGDELVVRLAVDRRIGRGGKAALVLNARRYADDELQQETLLRPGNRYEATGMYSFPAGAAATGVAYLGVAHRGAGVFALQETDLPAQALILAGVGFRVPLAAATLVPTAEARVFRRQDGLNQGHLAGIGAALEWPVGVVTVIPHLRSRFGKLLMWAGEESSFRGGELGLTFRVGGVR